MKAADISDDRLLRIIREFNDGSAPPRVPGGWSGPRWALMWDLQDRLPEFPEKVIRAKCRQLIKRGLLDGCTCGCRGDFELTELSHAATASRAPSQATTAAAARSAAPVR